MADESANQVIVEFIADTSQLQPAVDKLLSMGKIDEQSAAIFKATNASLQQRNTLIESGLDSLVESKSAVSDQQQGFDKLSTSVKGLSAASKDATENLLKMSSGGVAATIKDTAGASDKLAGGLENVASGADAVAKSSTSLRAQLKQVVNQLAELTLAGKTDSQQFADLSVQAGKLKNALQDTQETVANLGSDLPAIQLFGNALQAVTGGITAATGAEALFGDQSKDMEQVLTSVNGALALSVGVSQALNAIANESNITTAKAIILKITQNAQTVISNGLESESVIIRIAATVAQRALNLALALNPIGLVVIALTTFISAIAIYTIGATKAAAAQAALNSALSRTGEILDAGIAGVENANKVIISGLEERNARQGEIDEQNLRALKSNNTQRVQAIQDLNEQILKYQGDTNSDTIDLVKQLRQRVEQLTKDGQAGEADIIAAGNALKKQLLVESLTDQADSIQARLSIVQKNTAQEFALERQLATAKSAIDIQAAGDDAAKILAIRAALSRQLKDIDIAEAKSREDNLEAGLQSAVINAQIASKAINDRASQEEITAQKKLIQAQADFAVKQEGLTQVEIKAIRDKARQDQLNLQKQFNQQSAIEALQDQESANNVLLSNIKVTEKERLNLQIQNIVLAASEEIEQNQGLSAKIKAIEAKRDEDIRQARLQSIQQTLDQELALTDAQNGAATREIERQLALQDQLRAGSATPGAAGVLQNQLQAQQLSVNQQKALVDQLSAYKLADLQKQQDALDTELRLGLISQQDYNVQTAKLDDDEAQIFEQAEQRKTQITRQENAKRLQSTKELVGLVLDTIQQGIGILQSLYQQDDQASQARISAQKQAVSDLQQAGEITAKEAAARNLKLDAEQRALQVNQAKRDKEVALFQAIINTAAAVTKALPNPIFAAIAAAVGAAQIAVIAARPIPQFGKGKKGNYTGYAEVGETGPELISRGGRMELADKPTVTWLGPSDKVYNPKETAAMIEARVPSNFYPPTNAGRDKAASFDYDRLGKTIGDNIPQTGIGFDENGLYQWTQQRNNFTKYLAHRRRWKK